MLYVDNDPVVAAHTRANMRSTPEGRVRFLLADLRKPQAILSAPALIHTLDLSRAVGLLLIGVPHHLRGSDDPRAILTRLIEALAPGSYLVLTQVTADFDPQTMAHVKAVVEQGGIPYVPRGLDQVRSLLDGLEPVDPGVVPMETWRTDPGPQRPVDANYSYVAVARKR